MTASVVALTALSPFTGPLKKKRVLLVDTCREKRDIRAEAMRRLGMEVDCAADVLEARCWWRPELYNLVLFHVQEESRDLEKFCHDIRGTAPAQVIAFFVGKPGYLAAAWSGYVPVLEIGEAGQLREAKVALSAPSSAGAPQSWGILEACRRIAHARYLADTRTRALRGQALPPRDSEKKDRQRVTAEFEIDGDMYREEKQ